MRLCDESSSTSDLTTASVLPDSRAIVEIVLWPLNSSMRWRVLRLDQLLGRAKDRKREPIRISAVFDGGSIETPYLSAGLIVMRDHLRTIPFAKLGIKLRCE